MGLDDATCGVLEDTTEVAESDGNDDSVGTNVRGKKGKGKEEGTTSLINKIDSNFILTVLAIIGARESFVDEGSSLRALTGTRSHHEPYLVQWFLLLRIRRRRYPIAKVIMHVAWSLVGSSENTLKNAQRK